ncbi:alpha/beta hydrolase [soil metagenome]
MYFTAILLLLPVLTLLGSGLAVADPREDMNMQAKVGIVPSGTFNLGYRIEGSGMPAIVLGSATYYARIFSQNLRNHMQLIFMDNRAWVPSPLELVDNSEYELDVVLDDIELMRKALGIEKAVIIGHSGHAFMALEYAKKYPQNVSHVVMIGSGPDFSDTSTAACEQYWQDSLWPERKAALEKNLQKVTDVQLAALPGDQRWVRNYLRLTPKIWYDFNFDAAPLWQGVTFNMQAFNYIWGTLFKTIDIAQGLEKLKIPVFLALGRYDFIVAPPCSWNPLRPKIKNLTLKVFEKSGHTPQYEQPELFDAQLVEWLSRKQEK